MNEQRVKELRELISSSTEELNDLLNESDSGIEALFKEKLKPLGFDVYGIEAEFDAGDFNECIIGPSVYDDRFSWSAVSWDTGCELVEGYSKSLDELLELRKANYPTKRKWLISFEVEGYDWDAVSSKIQDEYLWDQYATEVK